MANLYHEADCIAQSASRVLVMLSCGRDSAVMLHILSQRMRGRLTVVHLTPYLRDPLHYQTAYLDKLCGLCGVEYHLEQSYMAPWMQKLEGGMTQAQQRDHLLEKYKADYIAYGYRMDESLQRRGMMSKFEDGMDPKTKMCYPMRSWTKRTVPAYVRNNRIPLAPEYATEGGRDLMDHRGTGSVWLAERFPEDWERAAKQDPRIRIDYVRFSGGTVA